MRSSARPHSSAEAQGERDHLIRFEWTEAVFGAGSMRRHAEWVAKSIRADPELLARAVEVYQDQGRPRGRSQHETRQN